MPRKGKRVYITLWDKCHKMKQPNPLSLNMSFHYNIRLLKLFKNEENICRVYWRQSTKDVELESNEMVICKDILPLSINKKYKLYAILYFF